jgi:dTMP kinase
MKGKLLFISGIDGSGKTTILEMLKKCEMQDVEFTSCLTTAVFEEELYQAEDKLKFSRKDYFTHEFKYVLHVNSIIYKMFNTILPILNSGKNVVLDRYIICVKLYADLFIKPSYRCISKALDCLPSPDLGIYFDVDIKKASHRLEMRSKITGVPLHFSESEESLIKKKAKYELLLPNEKYVVERIDANSKIKDVYLSVMNILHDKFIST